MASEWARKKAEELLASSFVEHIEECQHGMWDEPGCTCGHEDLRDAIAAALDEAQERGGKEALVKAVPLKELMSEALAEAREEAEGVSWLLSLTRALLESQGELMESLKSYPANYCYPTNDCYGDCNLAWHEDRTERIARAEAIRKGEV